jgi:PilZ domain
MAGQAETAETALLDGDRSEEQTVLRLNRKEFRRPHPCSMFQIEAVRSGAHVLTNAGKSMNPFPIERRASPRCDAVKNRSSIELEAPLGLQRIGATLVNLSRHGAKVAIDTPLYEAVPISLRIESPVKTDWVDARIVRIDPDRTIGLHFDGGCPDDLLLAGTVGIDLAYLVRNGINGTTALD